MTMGPYSGFNFETWTVLAQSLVFGIALAFAVCVGLAVVVRTNASTRFAVLFVTLIAVAVLPPVLWVSVSIPRLVSGTTAKHHPAVSVQPRIASAQSAVALPIAGTRVADSTQKASPISVAASQAQAEGSPFTTFVIPADMAADLLIMYGIIASLLLLRLGFSYWRLRRMKARTVQAPPELLARFH